MSSDQPSTAAEQAAADRRAIEAVIESSLGDVRPAAGAWPVGTRVRVVKDPGWDGPWKNEFSGTIDNTFPASIIDHALAEDGELEYSVRFDSPQLDADGDGPYRKAVIWGRYLRPE
ncbi:hypothetical protein [Leifsonia aquatica]|uniref:hypothetical protein n=1 Tax=Leifsonia aquatica TaxID=144185 RepID=UPI000469B057|nr:hypothetical protein [Leifsonia aquatica]